jgi:multiple sugar transport system substrate-binding protein
LVNENRFFLIKKEDIFMKKIKGIFALLLCMAFVMTAFAACAKDTSEETDNTAATEPTKAAESDGEAAAPTETAAKEPVTLRIWAHWGSEQRRPTIEKIIKTFNDKYADQGISAEYVYVPFGDIETKMIASVTAGNPANVVVSAIEDTNSKAMRNQAMNITEYLSDGIETKFYEKYWEMVKWEDGVYAIPFNTDTRLVFYNKTMFAEAGLDAANIKTWDDMINAAKTLDAKFKGNGDYMLAFNPVLGNFGFDTLAYTNGGGIWDDNFNPDVPMMNRPENIEALEHMKVFADMYGMELTQAALAANASGAQDLFLSGKVAMIGNVCNYIATIEMYNAEAKIDYGVFPYPAGPSNKTGVPAASGGGFVCTVPYGAPNPAESVLLAEFMATEGAKIWAQEQKDVMCSMEANENPAMASSVGWTETLAMMENTIGTRRHIYAPNATQFKDEAINAIVRDYTATDVTQVLNDAQAKIEAKIEEEKFIFGE